MDNEKEKNEIDKKIEEEIDDLASVNNDLTADEIEELKKLLKSEISKMSPKESKRKRILKKLFSWILKLIFIMLVYFGCFGLLNKFIKYDGWYAVIIYISSLSLLYFLVYEILLALSFKLFKRGISSYCIRLFIILVVMLIFNFYGKYFVFDGLLQLFIFYFITTILIDIFILFISKLFLRW